MPRANLSRAVVLAKAADLVDEIGYDNLSMAAIAKRFGVAVPSLYKHVDSLPQVRRDLAAQALRELGQALEAATAEADRRSALHAAATAYRRYAHDHPGRYAAVVRAPDAGDRELSALGERILEVVYRVLTRYGRHGEEAVHDVRILRSALHGFVSLEASGGFGMPLNVEASFDRMVDALDAAFARVPPSGSR